MRRLTPVVGFVLLVLLAGCGGGFGFDTGTETFSTVTPASVPTDDPLSDPPSGLSDDGISDSFVLADAHAEALENTSFTVHWSQTVVASNGTELLNVTNIQRVGANHSHWTTERMFEGRYAQFARRPAKNVNSWFNGSYEFYQLQSSNGTEYLVFPATGIVDPTGRQQLLTYYGLADSTTVSTVNGRIRVSMNIRPEARIGSRLGINMTERTVVLTLTETGRVERYRFEYTGRLVNNSNTVVEGEWVVRFTDVGETTFERPDWIARARNVTTTTEAQAG